MRRGEPIAADTEFSLNAGDYSVFPPNVSGEARNDGQDPAQVAVAELIPDSRPVSGRNPVR